MIKRILDITFSLIGLLLLSPLFIITAILIKIDSPGPLFFRQARVGKGFKEFKIYKFRTMYSNTKKNEITTTISGDPRITRVGKFLRRTKIDELPQLVNVFLGNMSLVGPRPDVPKYVAMFKKDYDIILTIRPGITDFSSIEFVNEEEILKKYKDPEEGYIKDILPREIELYKKYVREKSLFVDIKLIFLTLKKLILR